MMITNKIINNYYYDVHVIYTYIYSIIIESVNGYLLTKYYIVKVLIGKDQ